MTFKDQLIKNHACEDAVAWVKDRTLEEAWKECERGDWMLWLARRKNVDIKILTLAKVKCARLVEHLMTDKRSIEALNVAERFARGLATREKLNDAAYAAYAAADAASDADDSAAYAADASAYAAYASAYAAYASAYAAYAATDAASDAAAYAAYAADASAKEQTLSKCADIVRETIDVKLIKEK
jgi:hypothetical protein